jgi:hypothetical protein
MGRGWDCGSVRYTWSAEHRILLLERRRVSARRSSLKVDMADVVESDFLKERLFGLSNPQGNHGESIKEAHFHLDNTPTVRITAIARL